MNQSSSSNQLVTASTFESMFQQQAQGYGPQAACGQNMKAGGESFGYGFELPGSGDVIKTGMIPGGGGLMVYSSLTGASGVYGTTSPPCANCLTWVALVNTGANGQNWAGASGDEYSPASGINLAMQSALSILENASPNPITNPQNQDLFPLYLITLP